MASFGSYAKRRLTNGRVGKKVKSLGRGLDKWSDKKVEQGLKRLLGIKSGRKSTIKR